MSSPPTAPDQTSATRCSRWFLEEVHPHDSDLKDYIRRSYPSIHDVDDVVQESYLRIWRQRAVEPIRCARAFLFTVAQRIALDGLRRRRCSPIEAISSPTSVQIADNAPGPAERIDTDHKVALLIDAIDALPARCRKVVILRKLKMLSQRETATRLGISEKGVENQLARGIERCRKFLRAQGADGTFDHGR